ncbi:MAG: Beta-barrel assembly-enhancing protease [uncultured Thiotrichaceae bacterium]|uniref:Beta-barrel assembly-enhancing protease n=1 Tax=uncultured Thiotrichaceae bacterium TaxID=298394 RepID=A0A6S6TKG2_9GAMM|nr:MAG: Beta-barrel assembly-enhancing protease [uncultured Thiotrichaceae bacterium]
MMVRYSRQMTTQRFAAAVLSLFVATAVYAEPAKNVQMLNIQSAMQQQNNDPISLLRKLRQEKPEDSAIAARLATLYIQKARQELEPEYYQQAFFAIRPWWRVEKMPPEIAMVRATLYQHEHHYVEATELLLEVIQQQPKNSQAWLTLSTIQHVQGDYANVAVSCDALSRVASTWLGGLCYSQLYSVTGRAKAAYAMQRHLLSQLKDNQQELHVWLNALMAESSVRLHQDKRAEQHYKAVLALRSDDLHALGNYSDFLLQRNRPQEVIALLKAYDKHDALLLRTAMAAKQAGDQELENQSVAVLKQRFAEALAKHGHTHERDEALFHLVFSDDKSQALTLMAKNWELQKEPVDARSLLQAALANKQPQAAHTVIAWVKQHQLEDPQIHRLIKRLQML